jgi:hypothetical protein
MFISNATSKMFFKTNFSNKNPEGERFFQKITNISAETQNFCVTRCSDFLLKNRAQAFFEKNLVLEKPESHYLITNGTNPMILDLLTACVKIL